MTFFSVETEIKAIQMVSPGQLVQLDPLVYSGYYPLPVYEYTKTSGHNFVLGKVKIGYVFVGRGDQNNNAVRYYEWAEEMSTRLFRTGCNQLVLSMALAYNGPAFGYRVSLATQYYGGRYQLRYKCKILSN